MTAPRLSDRLRQALHAHVVEGMNISAAAKAGGVSREGLRRAMLRPGVRDLADQLQAQALTDLDRRKGVLRIKALDTLEKLMAEGKSETTRLKAAEILLSEKRAPQVAVQVVNAAPAQAPGYVYEKPRWLIEREAGTECDAETGEGEGT